MTDIDARRGTVKTILWAIMGILAVVTFARFRSGLGATTGLSDVTPWGSSESGRVETESILLKTPPLYEYR